MFDDHQWLRHQAVRPPPPPRRRAAGASWTWGWHANALEMIVVRRGTKNFFTKLLKTRWNNFNLRQVKFRFFWWGHNLSLVLMLLSKQVEDFFQNEEIIWFILPWRVKKQEQKKKKRIRSFVLWENLRRANLLTILSEL